MSTDDKERTALDDLYDRMMSLTTREVKAFDRLLQAHPNPVPAYRLVRRSKRNKLRPGEELGDWLNPHSAATVVSRINDKLGSECIAFSFKGQPGHPEAVVGHYNVQGLALELVPPWRVPEPPQSDDIAPSFKRSAPTRRLRPQLKITTVEPVVLAASFDHGRYMAETAVQAQNVTSLTSLQRMSQVEAEPAAETVDHGQVLEQLSDGWDILDRLNDIEARMTKAQSMTTECVSAVDPLVIAQTIAEHEARTLRAQVAKERSDKAITKGRVIKAFFILGLIFYSMYGVLWYLGKV